MSGLRQGEGSVNWTLSHSIPRKHHSPFDSSMN
ncbi:hypothetical protein OF001_U150095 [Pseudomonas sp. OF001]|nr:hypothetical protein OF001_U150095 [Pseudomonas sp. OF001]